MYYKIQSNYSDTLCMRKTLKTATHSPVVIVERTLLGSRQHIFFFVTNLFVIQAVVLSLQLTPQFQFSF